MDFSNIFTGCCIEKNSELLVEEYASRRLAYLENFG